VKRRKPAPPTDPILLENTMNAMKRFSALFLAIAFVSALGCAGDSKTESTSEFIDDSWITTKVKATLVESPAVKATEVNVETFKGSVQLSGFVSSYAAMNEAVRLTNTIKGVRAVKNDMRIK
jgi:osmotically-inducible protein OsmY